MTSINETNPLDALRFKKEEPAAPEKNRTMLDQEDFFALMTQQLAHQDPTKPADNNEMISQMTAFSTTDGISTLNKSFSSFAASMNSSQALQASSLVGRNVLVDNDTVANTEGGSVTGKINTDGLATDVKVSIENANGDLIQSLVIDRVPEGSTPFIWNGMNSDGELAPAGNYTFKVNGVVDGKGTDLEVMTYRKVNSVTLAGADGIMLNLSDNTKMALKDIVEVAEG